MRQVLTIQRLFNPSLVSFFLVNAISCMVLFPVFGGSLRYLCLLISFVLCYSVTKYA